MWCNGGMLTQQRQARIGFTAEIDTRNEWNRVETCHLYNLAQGINYVYVKHFEQQNA